MKRKTLNRNVLLYIIGNLALSQGFYGRLLRDLQILHIRRPDEWEHIMQEWENHEFTSAVEFISYLEGV